MSSWTWHQLDQTSWRLYRRGEPSVGRIQYFAGTYTGYWAAHPVVRDASLEDVQEAIEATVRSKPWVPFLRIARAS